MQLGAVQALMPEGPRQKLNLQRAFSDRTEDPAMCELTEHWGALQDPLKDTRP